MTQRFSRRFALKLLPACGLALVSRRLVAAPARRPFGIDTLTVGDATLDFRKLFAAGMTGSVIDLQANGRTRANALQELQRWATAATAPSPAFRIIRKASDFQAANEANAFAVVLNSQDAAILEETPGNDEEARFETLNTFHGLGLRVLQLTYNDRNDIGSGYWEDTQVPLSLYGRRLVAEMNRLGVLVDLSHCAEMTTLDAIKAAKRPMAATHAGCRAIFDHPRNKSDTVIRALADHGGYLGIFNMTLWMTAKPTASVATICDHIDHAVKIGGIDLVGFGSDHPPMGESKTMQDWVSSMTGWVEHHRSLGRDVGNPPTGHVFAADLNGPDRLVRVSDELRRRKYRQADIDKILGLNFIRVFKNACG